MSVFKTIKRALKGQCFCLFAIIICVWIFAAFSNTESSFTCTIKAGSTGLYVTIGVVALAGIVHNMSEYLSYGIT